jgi:hypothetical protein
MPLVDEVTTAMNRLEYAVEYTTASVVEVVDRVANKNERTTTETKEAPHGAS